MSWSKTEKIIARRIFELARQRDYEILIKKINNKTINSPEDIWELRELLNEKVKEFDEKYDYRYSLLLEIFMRLISEDLLKIDDLSGLSDKKIETIKQVMKLRQNRVEV